jgi:indolepyruvate ferredoxin oxidoreductase
VHGGGLRKGKLAPAGDKTDVLFAAVPEPRLPGLDAPYGIMVTGVGGTGVVTIGAIVGMAANLEGKGFGGLDMAGLAQKGGAVWSHLQIAANPEDIRTVRLGSGGANAVLGCDLVVSASQKTMDTTRSGTTRMVVNTHQQMTGEFTRKADFEFPDQALRHTISNGVGLGQVDFVDATRMATALLGDSIATNMFMLGYAFQRGLVPVSSEAIEKAIELNGAAVKMNQAAFLWGRRTAVDSAAVERMITPKAEVTASTQFSQTLDELIRRREEFLTAYQNRAYAQKYRALVDKVRLIENAKTKGLTSLTVAVARYYFKLMAYKDEYEVARLYAESGFAEKIQSQFEGDYKLRFHLAPPLLARRNEQGELTKAEYGHWVFTAFKWLSKLRGLRGTALDVFGYSDERRNERQLIEDYARLLDEVTAVLQPENHALAVELVSCPEEIRGYGHVKTRSLTAAMERQARLLAEFRNPTGQRAAA